MILGTIKQINKKGMPFYKDAMSHGNLYIEFVIEFPKKSDVKHIEQLKEVFFVWPYAVKLNYKIERFCRCPSLCPMSIKKKSSSCKLMMKTRKILMSKVGRKKRKEKKTMKKADIKDRNALSNKYNFQVNSIVISGNIRIIHY